LIDNIIADWKKGKYAPIYWLEGEETYYIDKLVQYAEDNILTEAEKGFNLTILYAKDVDWAAVVNACMRYPMFGEKQVVILKEAQQWHHTQKDKLEPYISKPTNSTILIVALKGGKLDMRTKFGKMVKAYTAYHSFTKMSEDKTPNWLQQLIISKGYTIKTKALMLMVEFIGNDLARLENELDKLIINLKTTKEITEDDIEKYIGISKEYNVFELQKAIAAKETAKVFRIIEYFKANPKAAPMQMVLSSLYTYFNKLYILSGESSSDDTTLSAAIGVSPYYFKEYKQAHFLYRKQGIEKALLLLHHYNLKNIGIGDTNSSDAELLKELAFKIMA
jgi:DNA polymerase-3 subunit delta